MESIVVNPMTVLATAIYCQLDASSSDIVTDFSVTVTQDKDAEEFFVDGICGYVDGICGYVETNHCGKEISLKFTITYSDSDDIHMTITHVIGIISEQDVNGYVLPKCPTTKSNEPTVLVDFDKCIVCYKWEDSLGININDLDATFCLNKRTLNAIAQDIVGTILAKRESV
jgi:hypothetical protein